MLIETMRETLGQLLAAIEVGDSKVVQEAQVRFSQSVEAAWQAYQEGKVTTQVRGQAIPRLMYLYATRELPTVVANPKNWPKVVRELRNIQQVTSTVIAPEEAPSK